MAEMLHYLQVAPFPKKLFRHKSMVGGEVHECSLCPHSSGSPPSPREDHRGSLASFHLLQAKPVCSSIFSTSQFLYNLVMGGDCEVLLVRLPPVPRLA